MGKSIGVELSPGGLCYGSPLERHLLRRSEKSAWRTKFFRRVGWVEGSGLAARGLAQQGLMLHIQDVLGDPLEFVVEVDLCAQPKGFSEVRCAP